MNSDFVCLIVDNKNEIVELQRVVGGKAPMITNLDMGGYRILNVAQPRDPKFLMIIRPELTKIT